MSIVIEALPGGALRTTEEEFSTLDNYISPETVSALRAYFRRERDEIYSLWRWPEDPRYVVQPVNQYEVAVMNEAQFWDGSGATVHFRDIRNLDNNRPLSDKAAAYKRAAQAYWWAHKKPHEFARGGEVWLVDTGEGLAEAAIAVAYGGYVYFQLGDNLDEPTVLSLTSPAIYSAERIYPPKESND